MAENATSTPTPLPVIPRPLVIGHVLSPEELAGLLRIGDALAAISERLAALMGRPGGPLAGELADLADVTLHLLDIVEGDPEAEHTAPEGHGARVVMFREHGDDAEDNGDGEPSLGAPACDPQIIGFRLAPERDPTSSQLRWGAGPRMDLEEEHDGREPEHVEAWLVPARLDVFPNPMLIGGTLND